MEKNISGKKFGRLTAIRFDHGGSGQRFYWLFKCDCGKEKVIRKSHVVNGACQSCGCLHHRRGKDCPTFKHGMVETKFYRAFCKIREKCYDSNCKDYKHYGARGIKSEWKNFEEFKIDMYPSFLKSMSKNGARDTTIDRINNNGNYSKENCKWSTYKEQERNRSNNVRYLFRGERLTLPEWCERFNIKLHTVNNRRNRKGESVKKILTDLSTVTLTP